MNEYWRQFDLLCYKVENEGHPFLVSELRKSQLHVNGFTDGWYEFLEEFEKTIKSSLISKEAEELANKLIKELRDKLRK